MTNDIARAIKALIADKMIADMNGMTGVSLRLQGTIEILEDHECGMMWPSENDA